MRRVRRIRSGIRALVLASTVAACEGEPSIPSSDAPLIYLVLNQRTTAGTPPGQYAFVLTAGTVDKPLYRDAERFELRRHRDGALFAWQSTGASGRAPGDYSGIASGSGNYFLPSAGTDGLGAKDIAAGESFDLLIETGGEVIRGTVTTPGPFALARDPSRPDRVVWPRVPGAAGYSVEIAGRTPPVLQVDTAVVIPSGRGDSVSVVVHALDPQLFAVQTDERLARSGLDNGYGVFGALTTARLSFSESR